MGPRPGAPILGPGARVREDEGVAPGSGKALRKQVQGRWAQAWRKQDPLR